MLKLKTVPQLQEQTQAKWWCQINRLYKGLFALHTAAVISAQDICLDIPCMDVYVMFYRELLELFQVQRGNSFFETQIQAEKLAHAQE